MENEKKFNKAEYDRALHKEIYDRMNIVLKKGEKGKIKEAAKLAGMSLNAYIVAAIKEKMELEKNI